MAQKDSSRASSPKDPFQKYLDAGIAFTNLTRARAEKLVNELVQSGEFRGDARARVDELIERSRKSQEAVFSQVRQEVDRQLDHLGINNLEDLAKQVAAVIGRTAEAGRSAAGGGKNKKKSAGKAAKKSSAKSGAKSTSAKKASAKKSPAQASAAKKAAKKKPAGVKTTKKSPAAGRAVSGTSD